MAVSAIPRRRGRPNKPMPTSAQIEAIAARVKNEEDIAYCLGIRPETLSRKKKALADFRQAIQKGRAEAALMAGDRLMSWMLNGEQGPGPLYFYLERKCGWTKPSESEAPSVAAHRGLSSDLVSVLREALLGELQRQQPVLIEGGDANARATRGNNAKAAGLDEAGGSIPTTAITVADKRAELLGRNGKNDEEV